MQAVTRSLTHTAFAAFLVLTLATPAWRVGPFTWWPVWRSPMLAGRPASIGLLSLLPGLIIAGWLAFRVLEHPRRPWGWGRPGICLPLFGLTLLGLVSLEPAPTWRTIVQVVGLGLTWLAYLFVINERPDLTIPLGLAILIQGSIAVGQFLHQGDLGLAALGEPHLDPTVAGNSILWASGRRWLRAYGLTAHPNVLGATLTVLLLLLLPAFSRARGWRRAALTLVAGVGLLGLLTSFSRAAWLAFAVGLLTWVMGEWTRETRKKEGRHGKQNDGMWALVSVPVLTFSLIFFFLFLYHDLVASRFLQLDNPFEARSLSERVRDAGLALELVAAHPWRGVGAGNFLTAVQALNPNGETVHNVPLLVTAELGLLGAVFWLWLTLTPFVQRGRGAEEQGGSRAPMLPCSHAQMAPWLALLIISLFDNTLWLSTSWRAAILFALVAAWVAGDAHTNWSRHEVRK